jgi:uncharacterized protein YkwD
MTRTRPNLAIAIAAALTLATAMALMASPLTAPAWAGGECNRWADKRPAQLIPKQARGAVLCLVNKQRRSSGRGGLNRHRKIFASAGSHSRTMARKNCFSHQCSGERGLGGRLKRVGYLTGGLTSWAYAENIAWGKGRRGTPRAVVRGWMGSSGHRAHILSGTFKDFGAGFATRGRVGFYTLDFGFRSG